MLNTPVLEQTLKVKIKQALDASFDETSNGETLKQNLADALASAIANGVDEWIKTATVTVAPGIAVATAGSPTAQTGATTAPGTGTIS